MNTPPLDEEALAAAIAANLDVNDPEALERAQLMAELMTWVMDEDTPPGEPEEINGVKAPAPRRPGRPRKVKQAELKPAKRKRKEAG